MQIYVDEANQDWVIKLVQEGASELNILRELLALPSAENHTIPAEIIPCGKTSLILMPCLHRVYHLPWGSLEELLCCAQQMLVVGLRSNATGVPLVFDADCDRSRDFGSCMGTVLHTS